MVNPMFAKFDQALGVQTPTTSTPKPSTRASQIRAIATAAAPTPNPVMETAQNYGGDINAAKDKIQTSITGGAAKIQQGIQKGGIKGAGTAALGAGEATLGTASGAVGAIFAPLAAPIQTLLSHVSKANADNPSPTANTVNSPEAQAARQQISDWAKAHPELATNLADAFNVGTAVIGSSGENNILNKPVSEIASNVKNAVTGVTDKVSNMMSPKSPVVDESLSQGLNPEVGKMSTEEARAAAWKDIQPEATDKVIEAYRAQGNTNPSTKTKGVTLNPSASDSKVLENLTPLYENGTITPEMTPQEKLAALNSESKQLTLQSDNFIADNNKIVETPKVQAALNSAKSNSRVVFGTDKTLESAYNAPQQAFLDQLDAGKAGATGTDTVSLRDALKSWDAQMKAKFPKLWQTSATGELSATDNARLNGIMDTHTAIRDLIVKSLNEVPSDSLAIPEGTYQTASLANANKVGKIPQTGSAGDAYKALLDKNSNLITAAKMLNKSAPTASGLAQFWKAHPYLKQGALWAAPAGIAGAIGGKALGL